ncbi:MAG: DUF4199 domain-containing protein [Chitinophagales bacterium]|nr:DUF4199 domain-containing protein [Chitinophagales bacterium]
MNDLIDHISPFDLPMKSKKIVGSAVNAGFITGLAMIAYTLIVNISGFQYEQGIQWLGLLPLICISTYFAMKFRQSTEPSGYLTFGQGFKYILYCIVVSSIISTLFFFIYISFIDTEYVSGLLEATKERLAKKGMEPEQISASIEMMKKFTSPIKMCLMGLISSFLTGAILGLIVGAIIRKEPK